MTKLLIGPEVPRPIRLRLPDFSDDEFLDFCSRNSEHRIERTAEGVIVITPGAGAVPPKSKAGSGEDERVGE